MLRLGLRVRHVDGLDAQLLHTAASVSSAAVTASVSAPYDSSAIASALYGPAPVGPESPAPAAAPADPEPVPDDRRASTPNPRVSL